nr:hypothetical protein [Pontibacter liquoris]
MPESLLSLNVRGRWLILGMLFFTTFVIPGVGAYVMVRTGQLDSMEMDRREQRRLPLLFTGVCYALTTYLLRRETTFDSVFYIIMLVVTASVFLTWFISLFWKVSAHSVGVGGCLGLLLLLNRLAPEAMLVFPIAIAVFLAGAVLSARLALHKHTPAQVYTGFASGLLLALAAAFTMAL